MLKIARKATQYIIKFLDAKHFQIEKKRFTQGFVIWAFVVTLTFLTNFFLSGMTYFLIFLNIWKNANCLLDILQFHRNNTAVFFLIRPFAAKINKHFAAFR